MVDIKKRPYENERQYIWRIGQMVDSGEIDGWRQIAQTLNQELRSDVSEYRDESAYRKPYQYAKAFYEDVFSHMVSNEYAQEVARQRDELYKAKRQYADQRREYNKELTADARAEHLSEHLIEVAQQLNVNYPLLLDTPYYPGCDENDAVLVFADWHYGMVTDNIWNTYNTDICKQRVATMVYKATKILLRNKVDTLHILLLGDAYHGAIHTGCRVASSEDACDQLMNVSEIMAQAISYLSAAVNNVKVYSTYGNHARTIQNKKDSIHSDNMEKIIPWWLQQRLKDSVNIEFVDSDYKEFIKLNVKGYNICAVHGDLDKFKDVGVTLNTIFTKKFGESIDYAISADKHHLEEVEKFGIESILVRSLCGSDEYANNNRLYSQPGQSLFIFNEEDGRADTCNMRLD